MDALFRPKAEVEFQGRPIPVRLGIPMIVHPARGDYSEVTLRKSPLIAFKPIGSFVRHQNWKIWLAGQIAEPQENPALIPDQIPEVASVVRHEPGLPQWKESIREDSDAGVIIIRFETCGLNPNLGMESIIHPIAVHQDNEEVLEVERKKWEAYLRERASHTRLRISVSN